MAGTVLMSSSQGAGGGTGYRFRAVRARPSEYHHHQGCRSGNARAGADDADDMVAPHWLALRNLRQSCPDGRHILILLAKIRTLFCLPIAHADAAWCGPYPVKSSSRVAAQKNAFRTYANTRSAMTGPLPSSIAIQHFDDITAGHFVDRFRPMRGRASRVELCLAGLVHSAPARLARVRQW